MKLQNIFDKMCLFADERKRKITQVFKRYDVIHPLIGSLPIIFTQKCEKRMTEKLMLHFLILQPEKNVFKTLHNAVAFLPHSNKQTEKMIFFQI